MRAKIDPPRDGEHYLGLLLRVTEVLGESLDYRETLRNVCSAAVESIADICIIDLGPVGNTEMVAAAHRDPGRSTAGGREPFGPDALTFAQGLARLCASAIGKARLFDEMRAMATSFQEAALPRIFPHPGELEFHAYYQPARENFLVGGDWYDAFPLPDGRIGVSVGDASGHGLTATVMMASVKNALRTSLIMEPNIGRALDAVDYLIRTEYGDGSFCTAVLGIIDPDVMTLRLATAGHPGPKMWDPEAGTVLDPFTERDLPLGMRDLSVTRTTPKTIRIPGGMVVFYTDGLVECGRDIISGEAALMQAIARDDVRDAPDAAGAIRDAMVDCEKAEDDIAILVARLL